MNITDVNVLADTQQKAISRLMDDTFGYDTVGQMMMDIRSSGRYLLTYGDLYFDAATPQNEAELRLEQMRGTKARIRDVATPMSFTEFHGRNPVHQYEAAEYYLSIEGEPDDHDDEFLPEDADDDEDMVDVALVVGDVDSYTQYWGERCKSSHSGCPACDAWDRFDAARLEEKEDEILTEADVINGMIAADKEADKISQAVAGNHYNDVIPGMQYMELMQHMLEGREGVNAHLMGQTYKYLMRAGKKDDEIQELRKARWYITCLIKLLDTGEIDVHNNDQ
jgi:hypothetical protein